LPDRQQGRVPPEVRRAGGDLLAGDRGERGRIVRDLQRAETLPTGVLGGEWILGAATATDQGAGGTGRGRNRWDGHGEAFLSSSPRGGGPELAPVALGLNVESCAVVAGVSSGRSLNPSG